MEEVPLVCNNLLEISTALPNISPEGSGQPKDARISPRINRMKLHRMQDYLK